MHEMSLAESVREIVDETARASGARRVAAVRLEIGKVAQVEVHAMRFAFEVVKRGSLADTARLDIVETDGTAWCMRCSDAVVITRRGDLSSEKPWTLTPPKNSPLENLICLHRVLRFK